MRRALAGLVLAASLATACADDTPTTPSLPSPTTSEFASQVAVNGAATRAFTATQKGAVYVTLNEAGAAGTRVGLGIGVPYGLGVAACTLHKSITTTAGAGPHLIELVDGGRYCVTIFDAGTLTNTISFKMTIVFP